MGIYKRLSIKCAKQIRLIPIVLVVAALHDYCYCLYAILLLAFALVPRKLQRRYILALLKMKNLLQLTLLFLYDFTCISSCESNSYELVTGI